MPINTVGRATGGSPSSTGNPWATRGLKPGTKIYAQRRCRLCYGHLAGRIGVAVTAALLRGGFLASNSLVNNNSNRYDESRTTLGLVVPTLVHTHRVSVTGEELFGGLGIDLDGLRSGRKALIRPCRDWTEQVPHLAGSLGNALAHRLIGLDYLQRGAVPRGLELTTTGRTALLGMVGVALPE